MWAWLEGLSVGQWLRSFFGGLWPLMPACLGCEECRVGDFWCRPWSQTFLDCEKCQSANADPLAERHRDLVAERSINLAECQIAGVAGPDGLRLAWVSASLTIIERSHHRQDRPATDMISTIKPRSVLGQTRQGRRLHQTEAGSNRTQVWAKPVTSLGTTGHGSGSNRVMSTDSGYNHVTNTLFCTANLPGYTQTSGNTQNESPVIPKFLSGKAHNGNRERT